MKSPRPGLASVGLVVLLVGLTSASTCEVPTWPPSLGDDPITAARGKVLLVALVKGYCGYCIHQAENLELLKAHLASHDFPNIEMLLVNGGEPPSRDNIENIHNAVNLTVLQDTEEHTMYNDVFQGTKDDFIVYNRCGQRAFFIPHPYSYIGHHVVERVLRATHRGHSRCHCQLDYDANNPESDSNSSEEGSEESANSNNNNDPHDQMQGDQPKEPSYDVVGDNQGGPSYDVIGDHQRGPSYDVVHDGSPNGIMQPESDPPALTGNMQNALRCPLGDVRCEAIRESMPYLGEQQSPESDEPLFEPPRAARGHGIRGRGHRRGWHGFGRRGRGNHPRPHRFHQSSLREVLRRLQTPNSPDLRDLNYINGYLQSLREGQRPSFRRTMEQVQDFGNPMERRHRAFHQVMEQDSGNPMGQHFSNPTERRHRAMEQDSGNPMGQRFSNPTERRHRSFHRAMERRPSTFRRPIGQRQRVFLPRQIAR